MKTPQSKDELMITYLGKFMPNLSLSTKPLCPLIEADIGVRSMGNVTPLTVSVDASIQGLGAAYNLLVTYTSRRVKKDRLCWQ